MSVCLILIVLASTVLPSRAIDEIESGRFRLVNNLPEPIVSLYELPRSMALASRGTNLLDRAIAPCETLLVSPRSIASVFLMMDSSGNSYTALLPDALYDDGLVHVDMALMGFNVFHTGTGSSPLLLVNSLGGIRINQVHIDGTSGEDVLGRHVLFNGEKLVVWLEPGSYQVCVMDETGACIPLGEVLVPHNGKSLFLTGELTRGLGTEVELGSGAGLVEVRSCLTASPLVKLLVYPLTSPGPSKCFELEPGLQAHDRALLRLEEGRYDLEAIDADGARYSIVAVPVVADTVRWAVSDEDLAPELRFPER